MQDDPKLSIYEQPDVVASYVHHTRLVKGEAVCFNEHVAEYRGKTVLDIGIGAGRTTPFLAGLASEYIGIDYSQAMVKKCEELFGALPNARFAQDDARELARCADGTIDAAVFSFNGIDTMVPEDRPLVLAAVRRVLKPGGIFLFSFHNSHSLSTLYRYHWSKNPLRWYSFYKRWKLIGKLNGPMESYTGRDTFIFHDGAEDFRLSICYVDPLFQLRQVEDHGFQLLAAYDSTTGEILEHEALRHTRTPWIYFACRRSS